MMALKHIPDMGDHVEAATHQVKAGHQHCTAGTRKDLPVGNLLYEGPQGTGAATDQRLQL